MPSRARQHRQLMLGALRGAAELSAIVAVLWTLMIVLMTAGCTAIEIRTLPDDQWQASYRTWLKDVKADQINARRVNGSLELELRQYESTETKALDVAKAAIGLAGQSPVAP